MVVVVAVFALFLGTSSTSATTESPSGVSANTYDNLQLVVAPTHATTERGPPASYERETDYVAAGRSLDDASARTHGAKAWPTTTDTIPALVVQIVRGGALLAAPGAPSARCCRAVSKSRQGPSQ